MPPGEADFEPPLCQTCLGDHAFQRGVLSQEKESCSWETQSGCEVSLLWIHSPERILGLCVCVFVSVPEYALKFIFFFNFFFLLWWILSYIEMKQPWVYMCPPS